METMVRVYKDPKDYANDVKKLTKQGWTVLNTVEHQPQSGFTRTFTGLGLLGSKPKAEMVVTFQRVRPGGRVQPVNSVAVSQAPRQAQQAGGCPNCGCAIAPTAFFCPNCRAQVKS